MRRMVFAAVCLLALFQSGASAAVGKTTVDPNTATTNVVQTPDKGLDSDARLKQKVTYQVKQGRLHTVASDLSRITEVRIFSGTNNNDWRIRDIPVTVSAKDIELGKLLTVIADASHTAIITSKSDDGKLNYRFKRTPRMERALEDYEIAQNIRRRQQFDREWAAAESLAEQPERPGDGEESMRFNNARAIGRLASSLGTGGRDTMKAGEPILLQAENAPEKVRQALLELATIMSKRFESGYCFPGCYSPNSKATEQDIDKVEVVLSTQENTENIYPHIRVNCAAHTERGEACTNGFSVSIRDALEYVKLPKSNETVPDPLGGSDISTKYTTVKWNDPSQEFLKMKLKLKKPDVLHGLPTLADIASALSDASGYTIICEDFNSHSISSRIDSFPQDEMTFQDVLRIFRWDVNWYVDPANKLIIAVSPYWVDLHKALVPESLVQQLKAKLEKDGVDLNDATPLTSLTDEQYGHWISGSRDLASLTMAGFGAMKPVWALYDSLGKNEKLAAMSDEGLSLGAFDPKQLEAACKKCNASLIKYNDSLRKERLLPTDSKLLSALKMRITSKENWVKHDINVSGGGGFSWGGSVSSISPNETKPPQEGMLRKTTYTMQIFGNYNGETYLISNDGPTGFPYFALKWKNGDQGLQGETVR